MESRCGFVRDFGVKTDGVLKGIAGRVDTHGCLLSDEGLILDVGPPLGVRLRVGGVTSDLPNGSVSID